ncbi:pilus assembly protein [Lachnospiraceae bacterium 50-23]|jgi:hypothetical protein|nr:pilus assembly protein [Dorea sp.]GFI36444.1 hypothetical protein IMSAGC015_00605 [Lachnospiraceae bacterium]
MNNQKLPSEQFRYTHSERASAFTPVKASITVEASVAVPIFFLGVVCLIYLLEMMAVQTAVRSGLQYAAKLTAQESYAGPVLMPSRIENDIVKSVGPDRLDRSIVEGGSGGIDCSGSRMSGRTGIAELQAVYKIRIPVPVFFVPTVTCTETMRVKAWTGYEKEGPGDSDSQTVYITDTGIVYHKDYHCTYLDLSVRAVQAGDAASLRNQSGGKYHACERCGGSGGKGLYITDYGDRYHSSLSCSGLKRTIYAVPLSEAAGKGACSKCGQ